MDESSNNSGSSCKRTLSGREGVRDWSCHLQEWFS